MFENRKLFIRLSKKTYKEVLEERSIKHMYNSGCVWGEMA